VSGIPCEDRFLIQPVRFGARSCLVIAVSDGAGSAAHGSEGAAWAVRHFLENAVAYLGSGNTIDRLTRRTVGGWLVALQDDLCRRADASDTSPSEFSATLLGAIIDSQSFALCQVGDGAIVVEWEGIHNVVFWPQSGEYANQTSFVTSTGVEDTFEFLCSRGAIHEIAVFTDGLQALALSSKDKTAFDPFFSPLFRSLRRELPGEASSTLQGALERFLNSARVNARTNDDKCIALASRMPPLSALACRHLLPLDSYESL